MNENEKMQINTSDIGTMSDIGMDEMDEFFNKHFIRIDDRNRMVMGFSDAFNNSSPSEGETDILINEQGGRHFRLILDGKPTHENPVDLMWDENNISLLKWDAKNKKIVKRTEREIQADIDAIPALKSIIPVEERIEYLEKTLKYHEKVIEVLIDTMPKQQKAQIIQFQKAVMGAAFDE